MGVSWGPHYSPLLTRERVDCWGSSVTTESLGRARCRQNVYPGETVPTLLLSLPSPASILCGASLGAGQSHGPDVQPAQLSGTSWAGGHLLSSPLRGQRQYWWAAHIVPPPLTFLASSLIGAGLGWGGVGRAIGRCLEAEKQPGSEKNSCPLSSGSQLSPCLLGLNLQGLNRTKPTAQDLLRAGECPTGAGPQEGWSTVQGSP